MAFKDVDTEKVRAALDGASPPNPGAKDSPSWESQREG